MKYKFLLAAIAVAAIIIFLKKEEKKGREEMTEKPWWGEELKFKPFSQEPLRPSKRQRNWKRVALVVALGYLFVVLLIAVVLAVSGTSTEEAARPAQPPTAAQQQQKPSAAQQPLDVAQQQKPQQQPVALAAASCEPAESLRCRELRGEIPPEPEIQGVKLDFGLAGAGPSFMENFGWWIAAALVLSVLVAGFTAWTVKQTVPIGIGVVIALVVIQNWWLLLIVIALLVVILAATTIRNILVGGIRGAGNALPHAGILFIIWEIVQTFWTHGTIGDVINRAVNPPQA